MPVTLIAAADAHWGIGREGGLPWHVPEDLRFFKSVTLGHTVVMGRRTAGPLILPQRRVLTLTRSPSRPVDRDLAGILLEIADADREVFVAGGGEVYRLLLGHCEQALVTRIRGAFTCDTSMPDLRMQGWKQVGTMPLCAAADVETWKPE